MSLSSGQKKRSREETVRYVGLLIDRLDVPILLLDGGLRVLQANQPSLSLMHCTADQLRGANLADLFATGGDDLTAHLMELVDDRGAWRETLTCRRRDDSTFEARFAVETIEPDPHNFQLRICKIETGGRPEIAQLKNLSDRAFAKLVEPRAEVFYRRSQDGRLYYVTSSVEALIGFSPKAALGPFADLLTDHPMNEAFSQALQNGAAEAAGDAPYIIEVNHRDGGFLLLRVFESPVLDAQGRTRAIQGMATVQGMADHPPQADARHPPAAAPPALPVLIDGFDAPLFAFDREGRVKLWNTECEILHRLTRKQVRGRNLREIFHDCREWLDFDDIQSRVFAGQHTGRIDCPLEDRTLAFWFFPFRDIAGHITAGLALQLDLNATLGAEREVFESETLNTIQELVGSMGNDFNNLLSAITGYSSLMQSQLPQDHAHHNYLALIQQACRRASSLTQQLLSYSSDSNFQVVPLELNEIVEEALPRLKRLLPPGVRVRSRLAPNLPKFEGNRQQIEQVLLNLCVNAGEAIEERGTITVETLLHRIGLDDDVAGTPLKPGRYAALRVSDDGRGIPEHIHEKVFRPYFSTHDDRRGMGLPAVAGIVKQHYGQIQLLTAVGAGTQISVYFPIEWYVQRPDDSERHAAELTADGATESGADRPGAPTILIVDDSSTVRHVARQMIEMMDYECLEAVNGLEGVRTYAKHEERIDLVLLDMMMPVMSGRETYECLRAINPDVNVIFSSGFDIRHIVHRLEIGAKGRHIQKPYTLELLRTKIDDALGRIPTGN